MCEIICRLDVYDKGPTFTTILTFLYHTVRLFFSFYILPSHSIPVLFFVWTSQIIFSFIILLRLIAFFFLLSHFMSELWVPSIALYSHSIWGINVTQLWSKALFLGLTEWDQSVLFSLDFIIETHTWEQLVTICGPEVELLVKYCLLNLFSFCI